MLVANEESRVLVKAEQKAQNTSKIVFLLERVKKLPFVGTKRNNQVP